MSAKRNLQLFTPYLVCALEGVTHGLYLLWVTAHRGVSPFAAASAIAAGDLALLVLEVPTGVFADRLGARRSLLVGSACQVVGIALFWQARSVAAVVAAALAIAFGDAFRHGADQALLYRSCAALGEEASFGKSFARAQAVTLAAMVGLTALGGWLAEHVGFDVAWALDVGLAVAGFGLAWAMTEMPAREDEPVDEEEGAGAVLASLRARLPWGLVVPAAMVVTLGSVVEMWAQTTPREGGGAEVVALAIAGALALEALGAGFVARGVVPVHARSLNAIGVAALGGLALAACGWVLPGVLVIFLASGMAPPIRGALVQERARDGERATVASASGLCDMLGKTAALPLAAWLHDRVRAPAAAAVLAVAAVVAWAVAARRERAG